MRLLRRRSGQFSNLLATPLSCSVGFCESQFHGANAGGAEEWRSRYRVAVTRYLRSDHCTAEWTNAIASDPLNKKGRLIVLRVRGVHSRRSTERYCVLGSGFDPTGSGTLERRRPKRPPRRQRNVDQQPTKYWRDGSVIWILTPWSNRRVFRAGTGRSQKSIKPSKAPIASQ